MVVSAMDGQDLTNIWVISSMDMTELFLPLQRFPPKKVDGDTEPTLEDSVLSFNSIYQYIDILDFCRFEPCYRYNHESRFNCRSGRPSRI